jgi:hypothetical protein
VSQTETEIVEGIGSDYAIKYGFHVPEDYFFKSGRESGQELIKEYLQVKSVWISTAQNVPNPFIQR